MTQLDFFGSTSPNTSPIGLIVRAPHRPCSDCGSIETIIGSSSGPHNGRLNCVVCTKHRGWLSRTTIDFVNSIITHAGRPDRPILISRTDHTNSRISANDRDSRRNSTAKEAANGL